MILQLKPFDENLLSGNAGPAARFAMELIVKIARIFQAQRLIDISWAHVASCYYNARPSLDFAELLARGGAKVRVPTTLTAGSIDLVHPEFQRGDADSAAAARRLVALHRSMGCEVTMTCAPYQIGRRPKQGEHIAWCESSAVVFANSVLGACTNRYVEFFDICAAITGRVPDVGLHNRENRRGQVLFRLKDMPQWLLGEDAFYHVLGYLIGREADMRVPVIEGIPRTVSEDQLRALGAAAAAAGPVSMFHAIGVTPEAATLEAACHGLSPEQTIDVKPAKLATARATLSTPLTRELSAVCLGTPHFSITEFEKLTPLLENVRVHPSVKFYVSTNRQVLAELKERGWLPSYQRAGVTLVADTCTYFAPVMEGCAGAVMTNSAKWAYYAPGGLGAQVIFASLEECVRSAAAGKVRCDEKNWLTQ